MKTRGGLPMFILSLPLLLSRTHSGMFSCLQDKWPSRAMHALTMIAWTCKAQTPLEMVKKGNTIITVTETQLNSITPLYTSCYTQTVVVQFLDAH